jgi:hypothetical protein
MTGAVAAASGFDTELGYIASHCLGLFPADAIS